jgi:hypothetical protein
MDSLLAILAAPVAASSALDAIGRAVGAAPKSFADVLGALHSRPGDETTANAAASSDLQDRIAERLHELFVATGAECASVNYDSATDRVEVEPDSPLAADAIALIEEDVQLMDDLRELAARDADGGRLELLFRAD